MEFDPLVAISREATLEASKALSKFVHVPVSLGTVRVDVKNEFVFPIESGGSDRICAVSGEIEGDAVGLATLCLPMPTARGLCDLLFGRELGTTQEIAADDEDALMELGNIVVGNYLTAFSRAMPGTTLMHRRARILYEPRSELAEQLMDSWRPGQSQDTMLFEVTFNFRHAALSGCVAIALEAKGIQDLLQRAIAV